MGTERAEMGMETGMLLVEDSPSAVAVCVLAEEDSKRAKDITGFHFAMTRTSVSADNTSDVGEFAAEIPIAYYNVHICDFLPLPLNDQSFLRSPGAVPDLQTNFVGD